MPQYLPGQSGNLKGKPKGTKDVRWSKLHFWFDLLEKELNKEITVTESSKGGNLVRTYKTTAVDPNKRAEIFLRAMSMLVSKMKQLPTSPEDSKLNADEAMAVLKSVETKDSELKNVSVTTVNEIKVNKTL